MKGLRLAISAPSGYNSREILLPLRQHLEIDNTISEVLVITPAARYHAEIFRNFGHKFIFLENPSGQPSHNDLFARQKPDVVLTPTVGLDVNDTPIIRAAKKNDIPVLTFIASWDNVFKMERLKKYGHSGSAKNAAIGYELPDYLAVWNQLNMSHLHQAFPEIRPDHIKITGSPRFDYFSHLEKIPAKQELLTYLGFANDSPAKIIHGATTELYPFDYVFRAIDRARSKKQIVMPLNLYASVHPGGNLKNHKYERFGVITRHSFGRRANALHPDFAYLPTDEEAYLLVSLFQHSDVLINQSSTVAIESVRADTPVINVKFGRSLDWWRWRHSMVYRDFREHYRYITNCGGTSIVKNKRELILEINNTLAHPEIKKEERRTTARSLLTFTDGSSSQRLLDYVKEIAKV